MSDIDMKVWVEYAATVLKDIAEHNQLVVSDMVIAQIEKDGFRLKNYAALGGVFTRAAKEGIIEKQPTTQTTNRTRTVWLSKVYAKGKKQ